MKPKSPLLKEAADLICHILGEVHIHFVIYLKGQQFVLP